MNESIADTSPESPAPATPTPAPASPPPPDNPGTPAARIVATGERTEREIDLESELEAERTSHATTAAEKKAREIRVAELEDELHRLKTAGAVPPRTATPAPARAASGSKSWTLFDQEGA